MMGLGLGGSGPRGIAAFAPNRHDLPTTLPGGQADDDAELSENDEPVWGRATLKKISKERVETLKKQKSVPGGVGFALVGSSGENYGNVAPRGGQPQTFSTYGSGLEKRAPGASIGSGGVSYGGIGGGDVSGGSVGLGAMSSRGGGRLLNLSEEQIRGQTWGTIMQQQRSGALGGASSSGSNYRR